MMRTRDLAFAAMACVAAGCSSSEPAPEVPEMTEQEMQETMVELATPGDHHRNLEPLVGDWEAEVTMWNPGDTSVPPTTTRGKCINRWTLGGRFVLGKFDGEFNGQDFQGLSLMGFDNMTQQYQGTWADSMKTMMMPVSTGSCSDDGKTITLTRMAPNPVTGKDEWMKDVTTIASNDHHTVDMWTKDAENNEVKTLHIEFRRIK